VLRYVLCANAPETKDNDFTWKDYQARNNNELVAILGNFVNRAMVLTQKYFGGQVPGVDQILPIDEVLIKAISQAPGKIESSIENYRFREALVNFMDLARIGNKYLAENEPWKLIKEDQNRVGTILNLVLQVVANLAILGEPFLPFTSKRLNQMIGLSKLDWPKAGSVDLLVPGEKLEPPQLLFEKIEDETVNIQIRKLEASKKMNMESSEAVSPIKSEIKFDDFEKLDLRIGTVLEAERVPKSKKLLKLLIDTGIDERTILSGIAGYYEPENMIGQQVTIIANLAPRKMMGIQSEGKILSAEQLDGSLKLLIPEEKVAPGSMVS